MKPIVWNEIYSVNIEEIDNQHKELIQIINELLQTNHKKRNSGVSEFLKKIRNYATTHFSTEEIYFRKFDYPFMKSHIEEHQKFFEELRRIEFRIQNEFGNHSQILFEFLKDWLIKHILGTDKVYISFFKEKGLN